MRGVNRTVIFDPDGTKHFEYNIKRDESTGRADLLMIDALGFLVLHSDVMDWIKINVHPADWMVNKARIRSGKMLSFSANQYQLNLFFEYERDAILFETFFG